MPEGSLKERKPNPIPKRNKIPGFLPSKYEIPVFIFPSVFYLPFRFCGYLGEAFVHPLRAVEYAGAPSRGGIHSDGRKSPG